MYDFDLIVIGSGAGGGVGAHYARALGKKVAVVDKGHIGGECPTFACVPTKALLQAAEVYDTAVNADVYGIEVRDMSLDYRKVRKWKNLVVSRTGSAQGASIFREDGITFIAGEARFVSPHEIQVGKRRLSAAHFLIATGSSVFVPPIMGLEHVGYLTFKEAVDLDHLPGSILVLGGGAIGCEFTQIFSTFGTKVHIVDTFSRILAKEDEDVSNLMTALFEARGVHIATDARVTRVHKDGDKKRVYYEVGAKQHSVTVDEILIATGKRPVVDSLDLERAGVAYDKHGVTVNDYLQTSTKHIYAAGDIVGPYLYTHTGYYQSKIAAHNMFSRTKMKPDYRVIPRCVFTAPEVASVGVSEQELLEKKMRYKKGIATISMLGRANTSNQMDGFVKVLTDAREEIIGAAIVAPRAGEMIHELALAMQLRAKARDVAELIHAYPTYAEAIKIACASLE